MRLPFPEALVASVTACDVPMFRNARVKLTAGYTVGIAMIMAAFSMALYLALQQALVGNLEMGGNASPQLENTVVAADLARVRLALLTVNFAGWIISALISSIVARRTLRPIEESIERQSRFAAHASHELRSPLSAIKGEIEATLAQQRRVEAYRETLTRVNTEVDHLERTVRSLLELARASSGQHTAWIECRAVQAALQEMAEPLRARMAEVRTRLVVEVPPDLYATLDWDRVALVIRNLLDSAAQHTGEDGEIRLVARSRRQDLELEVFASGPHVTPADRPHLFVPFYRGRGGDPDLGTGIGLALCEWVVRAQGGTIAVHNFPRGVCFRLRLPHVMK